MLHSVPLEEPDIKIIRRGLGVIHNDPDLAGRSRNSGAAPEFGTLSHMVRAQASEVEQKLQNVGHGRYILTDAELETITTGLVLLGSRPVGPFEDDGERYHFERLCKLMGEHLGRRFF